MGLDYSLYFNNYLKKLLTARYCFATISLFCALLLIGSYFVENVLTVEPCVLCTMQRVLFTWILGTSIVGFISEIILVDLFLKNFFTNLIHNIFLWLCLINNVLCSLMGILIASRQSWLQHLASQNINTIHNSIHSCGAGLEQLIAQYPLAMVFKIAIKGSLECSKAHLNILGLSLANWSLISFITILWASSTIIYKKFKNK